jgi:hypothetical protein
MEEKWSMQDEGVEERERERETQAGEGLEAGPSGKSCSHCVFVRLLFSR